MTHFHFNLYSITTTTKYDRKTETVEFSLGFVEPAFHQASSLMRIRQLLTTLGVEVAVARAVIRHRFETRHPSGMRTLPGLCKGLA